MISYAQNREDVILNRAFPGPTGFYIDVGAADPVEYSVTKWFSDRGWSGINIEPQSDFFAALDAARQRDVNLRVGVSDRAGTLTLYEAPSRPGWATLEAEVAEQFRADGIEVVPHDIPVMTLAEVCERFAPNTIDFLKIDVEGHESHVLRGADFERFRPRVLVVEATEVGRQTPNHESWEPGVLAAGYLFALFDGLNRFYVRHEDSSLLPVLQTPANVFDQYVPHDGPLGQQLAAVERDLAAVRATLSYYVNAFECRTKEAVALAADLARVQAASAAASRVLVRTRQHLAALRDAELRRAA
jgi:FkbM family methyltransferase